MARIGLSSAFVLLNLIYSSMSLVGSMVEFSFEHDSMQHEARMDGNTRPPIPIWRTNRYKTW
ncbi:hypothetical protein BJX99DRAFT_221920 [Aspergillus californicus]